MRRGRALLGVLTVLPGLAVAATRGVAVGGVLTVRSPSLPKWWASLRH